MESVTQLAHALSHRCCKKSQVTLIHYMKSKDLTTQLLHQKNCKARIFITAGFRAYW